MLVLSRHKEESVMIGSDIRVTVVSVQGGKVRLGIDAPRNIDVHRNEVFEAIQRDKQTELENAIEQNNGKALPEVQNEISLIHGRQTISVQSLQDVN